MLTCKDVTERCTDYLERDVSWGARLQYRMHLAMCAVCRRYVAQMRVTAAILRRLGGEPPPPALPLDGGLRDAFRAARDQPPPS
jgi:hypothetical protein